MKTLSWLGKLGVATVVIGLLAPMAAWSAPAAKSGGKVAAPAEKAVKAEEAKEGTISGTAIARASGGFLGLSIDGGTLKLAFYDAKKKPVAIDVASGTVRWQPQNKKAREFVVLQPGPGGKALVSAKIVQPPYLFTAYLTLLDAAGNAVESHVVEFRG